MALLIIGLILFPAPIGADLYRLSRRSRPELGEMPYKGVVALISLAGFILIVFGASALRGSEANAVLWYPPLWGRPSRSP